MIKDQAAQLAHNMDDAEVKRRIQQIAQRQWDHWGISIPNTKVMLLAELEHYKDRADQLEALRGELEAKDIVLERIATYGGLKTGDVAMDMQTAADEVLNRFRKEEIDG
ncbi:hypothetical protein [Cohnella sp. 56]|uniref:hypothetical protein n=1 Tax=Cohnella sp. 56 TaxID=3113722 RepID=UPI0030E9F733